MYRITTHQKYLLCISILHNFISCIQYLVFRTLSFVLRGLFFAVCTVWSMVCAVCSVDTTKFRNHCGEPLAVPLYKVIF